MVVVKGYFDASMENPRGITAVAGHVGTEEAWAVVERRWKAELKFWDLERFHLTDVLAKMGGEKGMLCALAFSRIVMKPSGLNHFSAAINDVDFAAAPWRSEVRAIFPQRQHFCLWRLFDALQYIRGRMRLEPEDQIQLVFDEDYESEAKALAVYDAWKEQNQHPGFDSVTVARRMTGLEVADLAAGITRRLGVRAEPDANGDLFSYGEWFQHAENIHADDVFGTLWSNELMEMQKRAQAWLKKQQESEGR